MGKPGIGLQIAMDYIRRFPNAATKTLAHKAYKENPGVWTSLEAARSAFRHARGNNGNWSRREYRDKSLYRPCGRSGTAFPKIPAGKRHFDHWSAHMIDGPLRALLLSDIHLPFHSEEAVEVALAYGQKRKANMVLLNGDTLDFFSLSRWQKDPRQRIFKKEIELARQILGEIRRLFPRAKIVFKEGNHEERWFSYMVTKAPEFLDIAEFDYPTVLGFDKMRISHVRDKRPIGLGKLFVIHGHEYSFQISNPVNPARGYFLRGNVSCVAGHLHQTSNHVQKRLDGHVVSAWSTGCLCDLHPDYRPLNAWNHGFAFVEVGKDGSFLVDNKRILKGKVW